MEKNLLKIFKLTARDKRYSLLANECKKNNIKYLLLGHHLNDLFENFLIRMVRGSGLNGLISFDKNTKYRGSRFKYHKTITKFRKKRFTLYFPMKFLVFLLKIHQI